MKSCHFLPVNVQHEGKQLSGVYSITASAEGRPQVRVWSQGMTARLTFPILAPGLERQVAAAALLQLHETGTST